MKQQMLSNPNNANIKAYTTTMPVFAYAKNSTFAELGFETPEDYEFALINGHHLTTCGKADILRT